MKFYKSGFFWEPLIICFILGIILQVLLSLNLASNTNNSPPPILGGLIAGVFLAVFMWVVFGKIDKLLIPDKIPESGIKIPFYLASVEYLDNATSVSDLILFESKIVFTEEIPLKNRIYEFEKKRNSVNLSDINFVDISYGFKNPRLSRPGSALRHKAGYSVKFTYHADVIIQLKGSKELIINVHRKGNIVELLKFFRKKHINLSEPAEEMSL